MGRCGSGNRPGTVLPFLARGARSRSSPQTALPGDAADEQARYIEAAVNGIVIACLYAPNGNPQPGPKFAYKLAWGERLIEHAAELLASKLPVIIAGDYNIVPEPRDIYVTTSYRDNALVQPELREQFQRLLAQGWTDAIRKTYPRETVYTFWDYMRNRWPRDAGLRLDHLLLSQSVARRLIDAGVDREVAGRARASRPRAGLDRARMKAQPPPSASQLQSNRHDIDLAAMHRLTFSPCGRRTCPGLDPGVVRPKAETDEGFSRTSRMWREPLIRPSGTFSRKGRRQSPQSSRHGRMSLGLA